MGEVVSIKSLRPRPQDRLVVEVSPSEWSGDAEALGGDISALQASGGYLRFRYDQWRSTAAIFAGAPLMVDIAEVCSIPEATFIARKLATHPLVKLTSLPVLGGTEAIRAVKSTFLESGRPDIMVLATPLAFSHRDSFLRNIGLLPHDSDKTHRAALIRRLAALGVTAGADGCTAYHEDLQYLFPLVRNLNPKAVLVADDVGTVEEAEAALRLGTNFVGVHNSIIRHGDLAENCAKFVDAISNTKVEAIHEGS